MKPMTGRYVTVGSLDSVLDFSYEEKVDWFMFSDALSRYHGKSAITCPSSSDHAIG